MKYRVLVSLDSEGNQYTFDDCPRAVENPQSAVLHFTDKNGVNHIASGNWLVSEQKGDDQ